MTPLATGLALVALLPGPAAPDAEKLVRDLGKEVARPELAPLDVKVPDPVGLANALLVHPMECRPELDEELIADLSGLAPAEGELYVAVPFSKKAKDTLVWRYDRAANDLVRVMVGPAIAPVEPAAKVLFLTWPDGNTPSKVSALARAAVLAPMSEHQAGWDALIEELMAHPDECEAELGPASIRQVRNFADDVDGELVLGLSPPGAKAPLLWRWDDDTSELLRIFLP